MRAMTEGNLRSAYGGESMAHMRYLIWAEKAEEDGFPKVGRLFRAIADAERVHASNHFQELREAAGEFLVPSGGVFGYRSTSDNLAGAIAGETFEVKEMYPAYLETARSQKEEGAQQSFRYALAAESIHARMFQQAKAAVEAGKDLELGAVRICQVCGWTHEGDIPDKCPICEASREEFSTFA
jgi:rubrerythrin